MESNNHTGMTGITYPPWIMVLLPALDWQQCRPNEDEVGIKI
jgi:hypothetical protein